MGPRVSINDFYKRDDEWTWEPDPTRQLEEQEAEVYATMAVCLRLIADYFALEALTRR
jgi:hypothetical protein